MIYISWVIEHSILKLVVLGPFWSFYHFKNSKNQNFEKWKNLLEISSFYTCVPKITIIWCMVPEIRSETDRIFYHFGPFFVFYHHPSYPPFPQWSQKSKAWKKKKKKTWKKCLEILSCYTYMCTTNEDHMIYSSWNIRCHR